MRGLCCLRAFQTAEAKIEALARGERGNIGDLLRILEWNSNLNINMLRYEAEGYTVLHLASLSSNATFIEGLLHTHLKIDADAKSAHVGYTALHLCSWKGDLPIAKLFCERALVDLEIKSREGFTALHYAAWAGSVELCFYLVSVGANLKAKNKHGYTPLLVAARAGNEDVVHFLVEQSAVDIDEADNDGCSGLHHACYEGHQKVVTILLRNEANSTLRDKLNRTPKDLCKSRDLADIISSIYVPSAGERKRTTFKLKVAASATSTTSTPPASTTDSAAGGDGDGAGAESSSKYRLENLGENYLSSLPEPPSSTTLSPQQKKRGSPVKTAHTAGGDGAGMEQKEEEERGYTLPAGDVGNGVGLHVAPKVAQECWRLCSMSGDAAALRRLLTAYSALTHGQPSPLYYLRDTDNWTLCMRAASKGFLDVVKVLLSVDPGAANNSCDHGWNALHRAAAAGQSEVVGLLLTLVDSDGTPSVRVDAKTERGATALMKAAEFGHVDVCKKLVLKGADENEKDKEGFTALHLASLYAHRDVVILLVSECQANPLAMTAEGDLPEDFTRSKHIKSLLRAVQFHHTKSASFSGAITHAQESELTQAWRAVEICIEQLRRHQGTPAKGADRIQRAKRAVDSMSLAAEALPVSPASANSPSRREKFRTPNQRGSRAKRLGLTSKDEDGAGTGAGASAAGSGSGSPGKGDPGDASKSAWEMIRTARSKRGYGAGAASAQSRADRTSFSVPKQFSAAPSPILGLGGSSSRGGPSPSAISISGSPLTVTSRPASPAHALTSASSAGNSPDNHMMSLRERLKMKYKLIEEKQEAARHGLEGGEGEDGMRGDDEEDEGEEDDVGLPLISHDGGHDASSVLKDPSGKTIFQRVPKDHVDALAAMAMAEDLMKEKDGADGDGTVAKSTTRKDMKGSLLLTMILTQVHMVYSNKISRAFYRWKHRFSTAKGSKSETNTGTSPARTPSNFR